MKQKSRKFMAFVKNGPFFMAFYSYKIELSGHSMSNHPMVETVPPQILMKIYTFGLYG